MSEAELETCAGSARNTGVLDDVMNFPQPGAMGGDSRLWERSGPVINSSNPKGLDMFGSSLS